MLLSLAGGGGAPTSDEAFAGVDIMLSLHKGQHAKNTRVKGYRFAVEGKRRLYRPSEMQLVGAEPMLSACPAPTHSF
ncbi:hypothetical protein CHLRE_12g534915v5 [Chlamydomonas reinhardtii]|uniref:Uncharacterized protein n=1 Tax=Chlamydomonas reinhardtii TaxID=3055 RepID=A0A2K3D539_CHLRE|nr:uncharacterized protein CHLRE_12g534915v5 [Chlamydomonas reinhardtii]PNW75637.1 hypothetical protein CHLRE_12g534915v5 [Chlamydomonas reinhardtii]